MINSIKALPNKEFLIELIEKIASKNSLNTSLYLDHIEKKFPFLYRVRKKNEYIYPVLSRNEATNLYYAKVKDMNLKPSEHQLDHFVDFCTWNSNHRKLHLARIGLGIEGANEIAKIIETNRNFFILDLQRNPIGDRGIKKISNALKINDVIGVIDISSIGITDEGAKYFFDSLINSENIITINIGSLEGLQRNKIGVESIKSLSALLTVNKVLTSINMSGCMIQKEGLLCLIKGLENNNTLKDIDLSFNIIKLKKDSCLKDLIMSSKLEELLLSLNDIGNEATRMMSEALNKNQCRIRKLVLNRCKLTGKKLSDYIENFRLSNTLTFLSLDSNSFSEINLSSLYKFISYSNNIKHLSLSNCKIYERECNCIAQALETNSSISTLILSKNKFTNFSVMKLVSALNNNYSIHNLDLSENRIVDEVGCSLAKLLTTNQKISVLNLSKNRLGNKSGKMFLDTLLQNKSIVSLNLRFNTIDRIYITKINARCKDNDNNNKIKFVPQYKKELKNQQVDPSLADIIRNSTPDFSDACEKELILFQEESRIFSELKKGNAKENNKLHLIISHIKDMQEKIEKESREIDKVKEVYLKKTNFSIEILNDKLDYIKNNNNLIESLYNSIEETYKNKKAQFDKVKIDLKEKNEQIEKNLIISKNRYEEFNKTLNNYKKSGENILITFLTENGALDFLKNERIREGNKDESKKRPANKNSQNLKNNSNSVLSKSQIEERAKGKSTKKERNKKNKRSINKKRPKTTIEKKRRKNIFANIKLN